MNKWGKYRKANERSTTEKYDYLYFVSFWYKKKGSEGFLSANYALEQPLNNCDEVEKMKEWIIDTHHFESVAILNFYLLGTQPAKG